MEVYTIGFGKKSAETFFGALRQAGIRCLLDVRLNNSSQLAGFTKRGDLPFFLQELCGASYRHEPLLAPTVEIRSILKKGKKKNWPEYERGFLSLLAERKVETQLDPTMFQVPTVLLCSEPSAQHCHRRLVAEYLQKHWGHFTITHL
jgi:uncharacterized protein (DUF488 family)